MRILYDSKILKHKKPFGTLTEGQKCEIKIHIPSSCRTVKAFLVFLKDGGDEYARFSMVKTSEQDGYDVFGCVFALAEPSLYFYYFFIETENESFSLYRQGYDQTNMEQGDLWQLSCVPESYTVPKEYYGAVMYQIFPDRFYSCGSCDTSSKLTPFWIHQNKNDIPDYLPDGEGKVRNCDFFGGNIRGITSKLDYLKSLGVSVVYLNPIFKAWSNHRYDTADYLKTDELLGTEEDFSELCREAHLRGMKIILDGVFSHTGSNSVYFDKQNIFGNGAYSSKASPYYSWYDFKVFPNDYTSWWGIDTLPCVNENEKSYRDFIIDGEDSVVAHWMKAGADGFRLDVADELPDEFIKSLRDRVKNIRCNSLVIGEVWEDASNKISYGKRRRYFTNGELDSVMNYPYRKSIIDYVLGADDGQALAETVMTIAENYPQSTQNVLMNILSTHDTERILTVFSPVTRPSEKYERAGFTMPKDAMELALVRLKTAVFLQFILPGMPCIYYGDEIGTEGYEDPFCRSYFDWERVEGNELLNFYATLSDIRNNSDALKMGDVWVESLGEGRIAVKRAYGNSVFKAYINTANDYKADISGEVIMSAETIISGECAVLGKYGFMLEKLG